MNVTIEGEEFVVTTDGGEIRLSFDVVLDRIERYALDLWMSCPHADSLLHSVRRGSMESFELMKRLQSNLIERAQETGQFSMAELSPQLIGLEGQWVTVRRMNGETASFIVGTSSGPLPIHLEYGADMNEGTPADRNYGLVTPSSARTA